MNKINWRKEFLDSAQFNEKEEKFLKYLLKNLATTHGLCLAILHKTPKSVFKNYGKNINKQQQKHENYMYWKKEL